MRLATPLALSLFALTVSPLGCAAEEDPVSHPSEEGAEEDELRALTLTEADNGKTVTVPKGQNVLVKLGSNPTTGYKWVVASTSRTLGYPATDRYTGAGPNGPVGSGGVQRLTWKTNAPIDMAGTHTVKLEYKRSWETGPGIKSFVFTVNIVDGDTRR